MPAAWPTGVLALINRLALFEPCELASPPHSLRPLPLMSSAGASMVLGHFVKTKGPRLSGPKPGISRIAKIFQLVKCGR